MKNLRTIFLNRILALVLTIVALMTGQEAWAESSWTVTNINGSSNTFTIKRSEKGYAQTVHFRTISLSAYAGQHFTAVDMDYTFLDNEDEKTVTVTEMNPSTNAYKYQTGASRKYGFEVTDRAGFRLAYAERSKTWGTSVTSSGVFDTKDVTIQTSEYTADDKGYSANGYKSVDADKYCTSGTQAYLGFLNAQLRMTLSFDAKENDDAYEYLQILFDNTSTCDARSGAKDGNPGTPNLSRYMAGFEMNTGSKDDTYRNYTFPVTDVGNDASATNPWGHGDKWPLKNQKFKSGYRATDGRLIVPTDFSTLVLRLNASGSSGSDEWAAKNVKAHIQAIDATAPTKFAVSVAPGRHSKGNTVYVSVAFTEIVTSSSPKLTSNWGNLTYVAGSGTNVLTFSTTIPQNATGDLNITGISGTIQDLAGNSLSGGVTASSICTLDADFAYTIDDFQKDGDNYLIKTHEDLIGLAGYVNGGGVTEGKTFLQVADIAFAHTTDWNNSASTEINYIAIGYYIDTNNESRFDGTYDGGGHTISGIRIYRGDKTNSDCYQGLFGIINLGSIVRNVNLADTRITGYDSTGGIVGYNYGTITDCTVAANVCIHSVITNSFSHGGIVGTNNKIVQRSVSSAILTVKSGTSGVYYGGIAGKNYSSTITDCIAVGAVIPDVNARGAIVGCQNNYGTLTRNYYHDCKVASNSVTPSGVGQGTEGSKTTSDVDGAQPLWAITLPTHASVVRTPATDPLPGTNNATYNNGADINGVPYAKGLSVVNLSYDPATITEGYDVLLAVKKTSDNKAVAFTDNGDYTYRISMMPTADITVSVTEIPIIAYIDADGNPQSHACTPIVEGTTSYQTLGRTEGWYVVNSDVTISGTQGVKFLDQQVNIILCDGTTLTSNATTTGYDGIDANNGSLAIYGQSLGTGSVVATASNYSAISSKTSINLNGGIISGITNSGYAAITNDISSGSITIRRGNVTATGSTFGIRDLGKSSGIVILGGTVNATAHSTSGIGLYSAYRNISILGGNVTATVIKAGGYDATGTITLGYTTVDDRITASSYACATLTIADGQTLTDGYSANTYIGTLTDTQKAAIAGKTMMKALGDVSYIDENGQEQICNNYKILSDGILTATLNSIGKTDQDTWYVASGNYTFNATYLRTNGRVHIILCDGASFTVNGSGSYGIYATGNLSIYGQSQDTGTLTANVANASGKALYVYYCNLVVNGGVVNANGGEYGIYIDKGKLTVNGGSINCSDNKGLYVNGDALMGSPLLAHHMPQYDIKGLLSVKLTMNSIGIMTYSGVNSLDFTNVSGLSAYVALSDADGNGNITLTRTYKPAGLTGMVLCGEPSASYIVPTVKDKDPDYYQNNLLRHVIVATEIDKSDGYYTNYILAKKNGNVGFYPLSGKGTLKPYSAYLQLKKAPSSRSLVLNFEEEGTPTGVVHTEITESTEMADAIYDLQGRRIEKPKKGLYIVNGRKSVGTLNIKH
ncbi:hypothetical protein [uncultured Prevotella sp.]|uniref:hypothetical protein n=1 Tax=uncultured Prevotella sp. TaxID=159272 RepID=UPI00258A99BB|nr:hypothetical protein [uncultured Prevotella sp.]